MKQQVLNQKSIAFIFTALLFIYIIHGVAYAEELKFIEGETTTREIAENVAAGANVGDPLTFASGNCLRFRLRGPDAGSFDLVRVFRGVQLKTKATLDYETKDSYEVQIVASGAGNSDTITMTINVIDVNEAPMFAEAIHRSIPENTAAGTNIGDPVSAIDPDGSLKYRQAIAMFENVLASMRPDKTVLLPNYPNPFNPETWIPYHLGKSANVEITIYNAHGIVVRHLELGHQSAGYYTGRNRAVYWDGKNNFGERIASGIYFYQLQADTISPLRKMIILK